MDIRVELAGKFVQQLNRGEEELVARGDVAKAKPAVGLEYAGALADEAILVGIVQGRFEIEDHVNCRIAERQGVGITLEKSGSLRLTAAALGRGADAGLQVFQADDAARPESLLDPSGGTADPTTDVQHRGRSVDGRIPQKPPDQRLLMLIERGNAPTLRIAAVVAGQPVSLGQFPVRSIVGFHGAL